MSVYNISCDTFNIIMCPGKTLSSALLFCLTCPRAMDAVREELSTINGEVFVRLLLTSVNILNKLSICQFSGSTQRPPQIAIHSSGSYSIVFFPTQPEAASQKNPNTLKVLLETARLASVLPIAPPRKITGPIQVQHLQIVWGVLQHLR